MGIVAFVLLALKRLRSQALLTLLLIVSVAGAVGLLVCIPVFSGAVTRVLMQEEMSIKTRLLNRPPFAVRIYALPTYSQPMGWSDVSYVREWLGQTVAQQVGLPLRRVYQQSESPSMHIRPRPDDVHYNGEEFGATRVACILDVEPHIDVVAGEPLGASITPGRMSVWILPSLAEKWGLEIGETYQLAYFFRAGQEPLSLRIAGFWQMRDPTDDFWYSDPQELLGDALLTTPEQYQTYIAPITPEGTGFNFWYYVLDDARMNMNNAPQYIKGLEELQRDVEEYLPRGKVDYAPAQELARGQQRKVALEAILLGFGLPLMGILAFFMFSIATIAARYQMRETALLMSRGSSRWQMSLLTLIESLVILAVGYPLGLLLGLSLARAMGYTTGFMSFVSRVPLQVHLAAADQRLIVAALAISLLARTLPPLLTAHYTVVTYERRASRSVYVLTGARLLLIAFLAAAALYAYQQLLVREEQGLIGWSPGQNPWRDHPLLLLAPTLFLFTTPLIVVEIFLVLMRMVSFAARLLPRAVGYLGFLSLGREGGQYRTPIYLLVLCLGLGVFYASLAKSADVWLVDRLTYQVGADLTFDQGVPEGTASGSTLSAANAEGATPWLLPIDDYQRLAGVSHATRVGSYQAYITAPANLGAGRGLPRPRLLGIDRPDFPRVAYFRQDFSPYPLGELMNRLGSQPNGVLVSSKLATRLGLGEGDTLPLDIVLEGNLQQLALEIAGTYDYFPTMYEDEAPVIVANLEFLHQQTGGAFPFSIWIRLKPEADNLHVLSEVSSLGVLPIHVQDLRALLERDQQRLERVGIFGLLSLCFLAGAILAGVGLLVYNAASLEGRIVRLAVLRALGMRSGELMRAISLEYVVTLLYGMVAGTALGILVATWFVPFFPLTENPGVPIPPFIPYVDWRGAGWIAMGLGLSLLVAEGIILIFVVRARISETLRLGTRP